MSYETVSVDVDDHGLFRRLREVAGGEGEAILAKHETAAAAVAAEEIAEAWRGLAAEHGLDPAGDYTEGIDPGFTAFGGGALARVINTSEHAWYYDHGTADDGAGFITSNRGVQIDSRGRRYTAKLKIPVASFGQDNEPDIEGNHLFVEFVKGQRGKHLGERASVLAEPANMRTFADAAEDAAQEMADEIAGVTGVRRYFKPSLGREVRGHIRGVPSLGD
jgi:hypothetical protein